MRSIPSAMPCHAKFHVKFCHSSVSSNVTVAFFSLLLDINECTTNAHNCDANTFCNNTGGSYNCTCSPGYTGNGTSCTGIYIILTYAPAVANVYVRERLVNGLWLWKTGS